jgi:hypothetical protein
MTDLRSFAGALTIFASIIMAFFGIILLSMYKASVEYYNVRIFYPGLYLGILNLSTFAISLAGGVALLKKKYFTLSIIGVVLVLASGLAPAVAFALDAYIWSNGLILGLPMVFLSIASLAFVAVSKPRSNI